MPGNGITEPGHGFNCISSAIYEKHADMDKKYPFILPRCEPCNASPPAVNRKVPKNLR